MKNTYKLETMLNGYKDGPSKWFEADSDSEAKEYAQKFFKRSNKLRTAKNKTTLNAYVCLKVI